MSRKAESSTKLNTALFAALLSAPLAPIGALAAEPAEILLYAAASLRDALQELGPAAELATGTRLVLNLGASNDLARQIIAANKADVFFSADEGWMDRVAEADLLDAGSRRSPLSNRLAVVVPADSSLRIASAEDLASPAVRRLSLANPEAVPAGKYAKAWLEAKGQWDALAARVVPAVDVRAALAAVEWGALEAGVVYRTDAAMSSRVRVVYEVPEGEGPRISYAIAALRERPNLEAARAVVAWLSGPEAAPVFERFGFVVRPRAGRFAHGDWTSLLASHVDDRGLVDYAGFAGDRMALEAVLARLATRSPDSHPEAFPTPQHALAYWINAYNALTIRGVLDRGIDTPSVWGDGLLGIGFFTAERGVLGGRTVSLKELEDDIVRGRFADPRIHAALNCASISCPRLPRAAFEGETLEATLDAAMREFVAEETNCALDTATGTVTLSKIFDWFAEDFLSFERRAGSADPSVLDYVNRYRAPGAEVPTTFRVAYRPYDKGLNRQPAPR